MIDVDGLPELDEQPPSASALSSKAVQALERLVAGAAPIGLVAVRSDGAPLFANGALVRMLGYRDPKELLAVPLRKLHAHPESALEILMERAEDDSIDGVELDLLRKDGDRVHVRIHLRLLPVPDGTVLFVASVEDVTVPREAQEAAVHTQKMEAVARFAAGIAHDYNNLLTSILGECTQVLSEPGGGAEVRGSVVRVMQAARRAAHLTQRLLVFAKSEVVRTETFDLAGEVAALRPSIEEMVSDDIALSWRSEGPTGTVRMARRHLEHIIAHLVANARDAMPAGGGIVVETGRVTAPEDTEGMEFHPPVPPGAYASLAVGDRGVGMSRETRVRMFDPFFTTKPVGQGAGLGLTVVYAMVQRAHGHISVMSAPAYGTVARILLPVHSAEEQPRPVATVTRAQAAPARTRTVLLVDDDDAVRDVMVRFLRRADFHVLEASDALEAMKIVRSTPGRIDLLVTDVMMPHVKGTELAEWVAELRPETGILLVSGYIDSPKIQEWVETDPDIFLAKPFEPDELVRRVRQRLDAG